MLSAQPLENRDFRLEVGADGAVQVSRSNGDAAARLEPSFTVLHSVRESGYHRNNSNYPLAPRTALRWEAYQQPLGELVRWRREEMHMEVRVTEDSQGRRIWDYGPGKPKIAGQYAQGTTNPFLVGERFDLRPRATRIAGRAIHWEFDPTSAFSLEARVFLPESGGHPEISYALTAAADGYFAAAFTGCPGVDESRSIVVPQQASAGTSGRYHHVVAEVNEKLPRAHVSDGRSNFQLVVHPDAIPFAETLVDYRTSRFGTMIRRHEGRLHPVVFAPVMGAESSRMRTGERRRFSLLFVSRTGDWRESYRHVAEEIYRLRDQRDNSGAGPLNAAIGRVRDYLADRLGGNHAMWHAEQKYYNYWSDQAGLFKPFSPLYGLSAAVILDDEAFYRERALPAVEFALSRAANTFAPYSVPNTGQVRVHSRVLGSPYITLPQLVSLWEMYQRRTHAFRVHAEAQPPGSRPLDQLAMWKLTGRPEFLEAARVAGERAVTGGGGDYMDFLELHDVIPDPRFLEGARTRIYAKVATGVNLFPLVPDDEVTVDRGGRVPVHAHSVGRHRAWGFPPPEGLETVEQRVPAWRVSEIGLESFSHHRAELWPNHPPQVLRAAALSGDDFLRTVARWGMVGRYANYAGDNRTERSLVTEKIDAPEFPIWKLTYSSINPGHAWEFIGAMLDYLVTDCFDRSRGQIAFPGLTMAGSPFRVRVYGAEPGRFHDDRDVRLWMPSDLIVTDSRQVDWVSGWGNGRFYLALLNQSFRQEDLSLRINPARLRVTRGARIRLWANPGPASEAVSEGQEMRLRVPAKGIVALAIDRAEPVLGLQAKMHDPTAPVLGASSLSEVQAPFGRVCGALLSLGRGLTNAFIYTDALPEDVISARLRWRQGTGAWRVLHDAIFPYEFSVPVEEDAGDISYTLEVENAAREILGSETRVLRLSEAGRFPGRPDRSAASPGPAFPKMESIATSP
jgi:hypothetical protein